MVKVLHLCAGNLFGGVETYLLTLAKGQALLPQMQHEFALCFEGQLATQLRSLNATVHQLNSVRSRYPWTVWSARSQLKQLLQRRSFDVVLTHSGWAQAIFGAVVKQQKHRLGFVCHDRLTGQHWIDRWAKRTAPDFCIVNSHYSQEALSAVYSQVQSYMLRYPIFAGAVSDRVNVRAQVRSTLQTPPNRVVIVQTCRLEPWKGHRLLLSALGHLKHVPNWEVWIAGGAQRSHEVKYLESLKAQAEQLGIIDRVQFLGQRSDVSQLLIAADIHCQPNTDGEPFGIAFIEALYAGLPLVTTAIGAATEIVDQTCGVLVPPGDSRELAQALEQLITDSKERDRLARGGFDRANSLCDPVQQLTKLHAILPQAIAKNSWIAEMTKEPASF